MAQFLKNKYFMGVGKSDVLTLGWIRLGLADGELFSQEVHITTIFPEIKIPGIYQHDSMSDAREEVHLESDIAHLTSDDYFFPFGSP